MSTIDTQKTIGQLVAEKPSRARLFEQLGIDYCCGGKRPLAEACAAKGLDANTVAVTLTAAESMNAGRTSEKDWTTAPMSELIDNILVEHHDYLREEMPRISFLTEKVANAHGDRNAALAEVATVFAGVRAELEQHMAKEEQILFPLIRRIEAGETSGFHCGSIQNPIAVMEREHDSAGNALEALRELTEDFTVPEWGCNTYRAMLDALETFERNMHTHVHKENNILFPRAIEAESATPVAA
jgi:regulator of cell morphogenesis and NO signaling